MRHMKTRCPGDIRTSKRVSHIITSMGYKQVRSPAGVSELHWRKIQEQRPIHENYGTQTWNLWHTDMKIKGHQKGDTQERHKKQPKRRLTVHQYPTHCNNRNDKYDTKPQSPPPHNQARALPEVLNNYVKGDEQMLKNHV